MYVTVTKKTTTSTATTATIANATTLGEDALLIKKMWHYTCYSGRNGVVTALPLGKFYARIKFVFKCFLWLVNVK